MINPDNETKIKLIEDRDAAGEVAEVYDEWRAKSGRQKVPGILKCFSHRPDFLRVEFVQRGLHLVVELIGSVGL